MKIIQHLKHLGEGACEVECSQCKERNKPISKFLFNISEPHNNGNCVCPQCGHSERLKDLPGLYFAQVNYEGGSGGKNWQCGNCGCEFIFHNGETEGNIQCLNCGHYKPSKENT
jgi:hypothetical protein